MADVLQELIATADFPTPVSRALQGARVLANAGDMAIAIDRMAVTLTAELQDQSPVILGVLPGGSANSLCVSLLKANNEKSDSRRSKGGAVGEDDDSVPRRSRRRESRPGRLRRRASSAVAAGSGST